MRELRCQRRLLSGKAVRFFVVARSALQNAAMSRLRCTCRKRRILLSATNARTTPADASACLTDRRASRACAKKAILLFLLALPWPTMRYMVIRLVERWCAGGCVSKHRRCRRPEPCCAASGFYSASGRNGEVHRAAGQSALTLRCLNAQCCVLLHAWECAGVQELSNRSILCWRAGCAVMDGAHSLC